ncbi:hypothetical protein J2S70_001081 [Trueperella bonasi]|uniref:Gram-positive cocci surface proteins LPxTG domain-containing protein n=1 Tax=Trueperella bonasi TaxID=312286 RepID=A0ABT9NGG8_9ACTO|nr:SpaA isopeptide-forming pilin-related protein [Trueperella bonasi]MDP9806499.1 hypothetical protein [Trueperella bonasi]
MRQEHPQVEALDDNWWTMKAPVNIVSGAISPKDKQFYFGGYRRSKNADNTEFVIYRFDSKDARKREYLPVGYVDLGQNVGGPAGGANGDMAFDQSGNMYILVASPPIGQSPGKAELFTVGHETLESLSPDTQLQASNLNLTGVNIAAHGLAFDYQGNLHVQTTGSKSFYYKTRGLKKIGEVQHVHGQTTNHSTRRMVTDLASSGIPYPVITVRKEIDGQRRLPDDQFRISYSLGGTEISSNTTAGNSSGPQFNHQVGPFPVTQDGALVVKEEMAPGSTSTLDDYQKTWVCKALDFKGNQKKYVEGTQASLELYDATGVPIPTGEPTDIAQINCTITNTPIGEVTWNKVNQDGHPLTGAKWTIEEVHPTTGQPIPGGYSYTIDDCTETCGTGLGTDLNSALAGYEVKLDASKTYRLTEVKPPEHYMFDPDTLKEGQEHPQWTIDFNDEHGEPRALVELGKIKNLKSQTITIAKIDANTKEPLKGVGFQLWEDVNNNDRLDRGADKKIGELALTDDDGKITWSGPSIISGRKYLIEEIKPATGYQALKEPHVVVAHESDREETIENHKLPAAFTWGKISADSAANPDYLSGSQWEYRSRTQGASWSQWQAVEDCEARSVSACSGPDQNPEAGKFEIAGLDWAAEYELREVKAPAGYKLDPESRTITFDPNNTAQNDGRVIRIDLGNIENTKATPPSLPFTGGTATTTYIAAGGLTLALAALTAAIAKRRAH